MKRLYLISGFILSILTFFIFLIVTVNEDISVRICASVIFPIIAFLLSFPCSLLSRRILRTGDKINKKSLKIIYYIAVPIISMVLFAVVARIIYFFDDLQTTPKEFSTSLSNAILVVSLLITAFVGAIIPYIQTFIVIILRFFLKEDK